MSAPIRIFVVDDHALFREGLLRLLGNDPAFHIVGSTDSVEVLLQQLPEVDVLILDYDLGTDTALTAVHALRDRNFSARILVVTAGLPHRDALELIRQGVSGIFHKKDSPDDLRRSILEVAAGKVLIDQNYFQALVSSADVPDRPAVRFTDRDRQILRFLLEGCPNKEIASRLRISESAVKASIQSLFAKTGVRTRSQLVRFALEQEQGEA